MPRLQLVRNVGRQILRRPQSVPGHELEALEAGRFLDGRNLGRRRHALEAGDGERLDLAALRQRQRRQHRIGEELDLPAHEIGQRRRRALVGDHQRVEPGVALEQLDRQMAGGADAGGAEGVFLRVLADEIEQILEIVRRHARRGADDQRPVGQQHDRREVVDHVIGHVLVEERIDHVDGGRHQQRVAVGRGLGDRVGADDAGCAARRDSRR